MRAAGVEDDDDADDDDDDDDGADDDVGGCAASAWDQPGVLGCVPRAGAGARGGGELDADGLRDDRVDGGRVVLVYGGSVRE